MLSPPSGPPAAVLIPRTLGNVRLGEVVGRGAGGVVHAGFDTVLGRPVAVKIMSAAVGTGEAELSRFVEAVRSAASVKHENIVTVYSVDQVAGLPVIIMEFVDGATFKQLLKAAGRLEIPLAVHALRGICAAVAALHEQHVVHRDLKPANVMFDLDGGTHVCDFGLACRLEDSSSAHGREGVSGTPLYMAPEMFEGTISPQSDVYALGIMLFEAVTGHAPYSADSMDAMRARHADEPLPVERAVACGADEALREVIERAAHKRRILRYKTAGHMLRALESLGEPGRPDRFRQQIAGMVAALRPGAAAAPACDAAVRPAAQTTFDLVAQRARSKRRPGRA